MRILEIPLRGSSGYLNNRRKNFFSPVPVIAADLRSRRLKPAPRVSSPGLSRSVLVGARF